jgi:predicted esterase
MPTSSDTLENTWGPHQDQPVLSAGAPLRRARAVVLLLHGRGASAEDILSLSDEFTYDDVAYLAPQAAGYSWYPYSFLVPLERNEPGLSSALQAVADTCNRVEDAGIPAERTVLLGFSQGACLAVEFAARNARRYGGVVGLSGGLIGPDGTTRDYEGSLAGTPVILGCSDTDPHIPLARVHESAEVLTRLGGAVTERIYPGMPHAVNQDEIKLVDSLLQSIS